MNKLVFTLAIGAAALNAGPARSADQADQIIRGQYQAVLGDCAGCHTQAGGKPLAADCRSKRRSACLSRPT